MVFMDMIKHKKQEIIKTLTITEDDLQHYNSLSEEYKQLVLEQIIQEV